MFDTRIIRRLAYDGNYQRAIELIVDIIDEKNNYFEVKEDIENYHNALKMSKKTENEQLKEKISKLLIENETLYKIIEKLNQIISKMGVETDNVANSRL